MDKNRLEGLGRKIKGSIKSSVGKLTGDKKMQAEGEAEKLAGSVQSTVGNVKDTARNVIK
jgi:uncharacterized protein YjbJ (UPF0337 family)